MAGVTFLSENPSLIIVVTVFALIFLLIGFGAVHFVSLSGCGSVNIRLLVSQPTG